MVEIRGFTYKKTAQWTLTESKWQLTVQTAEKDKIDEVNNKIANPLDRKFLKPKKLSPLYWNFQNSSILVLTQILLHFVFVFVNVAHIQNLLLRLFVSLDVKAKPSGK